MNCHPQSSGAGGAPSACSLTRCSWPIPTGNGMEQDNKVYVLLQPVPSNCLSPATFVWFGFPSIVWSSSSFYFSRFVGS
jgi:hypothetical protein